MTKEELKEQAREEFKGIYPLQQWNENNSDQAIFINPTLQKSHRDICLNFIDSLIDKTVQMTEERIVEKIKEAWGYRPCQCIYRKEECNCGDYSQMWSIISLITNKSDINK